MATLEVFFAGLICFIDERDGDSQKTSAVLIPENSTHQHWITFNGASYELKGDVEFIGLPAGPATSLPFFMDTVPKLYRYTKEGTKRNKNAPGLRVTLPKGNLTVASHFEHRALYALRGQEVAQQDVARLTVLLIKTNNTEIHFKIGNQPLRVSTSSFMLIENTAREHPSPQAHWRMHRRMTTAKDDSEMADVIELLQNEASDPTFTRNVKAATAIVDQHGPHCIDYALHTQCSNTQWP